MRLYIPTSSLNADNILSCECVAPAGECRKRDFGYAHFEVLEELYPYEHCTLAFTKVPTFSIADPSRENYPMVVEMEIPDIEKAGLVSLDVVVEGAEIFATATPLIVSPTHTRLLFYEKKALEYTLHCCADSAKCKLFDLFRSDCFAIVSTTERGATLSTYLTRITTIPPLSSRYSQNAYNKAKCFIWGFGMGSLLSTSPQLAELLKIQKRIYAIISSSKNDKYIPE